MKKRFSDPQIISILREAEAGVSARELCRKHAISDATFYTWRKKYGGMEVWRYGGMEVWRCPRLSA
jgi:putative transposase